MQTPTAKFYDQMYFEWIGPHQTQSEVDLIRRLVPPPAKILDLGCGTGRHLVPLSEFGYTAFGVDISESMLEILHHKNSQIQTFNLNILDTQDIAQLPTRLAGVICMWNAIFEIAHTDEQLEILFTHISTLLKKRGLFLFSTSDAEEFEPQETDYTFFKKIDGKDYCLQWKLLAFDTKKLITTARETISRYDLQGNVVETVSHVITQKQWRHQELLDMAEQIGFEVDYLKLGAHSDKYFVLKKK